MLAAPRRFHRRDSLLALFWPELDQEHARAALRRSLYFLRAELGSVVVTGRGDDEVGVPEEALWCDATALERALDAGDAEAAVGLYRGPLLEGLYVAGAAAEYQDWLDRERTHLRGRAAVAARMLVDRMESEGRLADAARWCRRALELGPDEASLRRLLSLLDRSGDRSSALRAYDEFARRMKQEFELDPSEETRELVEVIRHRVTLPSPSRIARPETDPRDPATAPSTKIAVLPFSVRGDARYAYLGEGMVDLPGHQARRCRRASNGGSVRSAPLPLT